jgi:hypothetical protein
MSKARDIASAAPAPSTVSATEIGYLDGVTSAIQTQLDAKTAKSTLTTTGDIYYASAANTPARLGIGTASQILAVNSGATAPEWVAAPSSGSMTLLSTTTLSGATTTISGISGAYKDLVAVIYGVTNATAAGTFRMRPNGATTNCFGVILRLTTWGGNGNGEVYLSPSNSGSGETMLRTSADNAFYVTIGNYASTASFKPIQSFGHYADTGLSPRLAASYIGGYGELTAITSLTFLNSGGDLSTGTVLLYGVK